MCARDWPDISFRHHSPELRIELLWRIRQHMTSSPALASSHDPYIAAILTDVSAMTKASDEELAARAKERLMVVLDRQTVQSKD